MKPEERDDWPVWHERHGHERHDRFDQPGERLSHATGHHAILPEPHVTIQPLPPEPATRRIHQYGLMMGLAVLVVVCTVWLVWSYATKNHEAKENAVAAQRLCKQVNNLGQPCATRPAAEEGVSGDAAMPAPTTGLTGDPVTPTRGSTADPVPTDENGVPQAFAPGEDALIVAVNVSEGRLILTYDDGARVDAGPVNEETLAIVLKTLPSASPSPSPVAPSTESAGESPAQSATPEEAPS